MLRSTFVHLPGIGLETERRLWGQGCTDWSAFLDASHQWPVGSASREVARRELCRSSDALERGEHQYFARKLRQRHVWRAWPEFRHSCVYLDIETDGTSDPDGVTVIGLYDGQDCQFFVKGENLESFRSAISRYSAIVTFFGTGFDIPVLQKRFGGLVFDQIHIDLCNLMKALGIRGGLKKIEKQLGIERSEETAGLTGYDAVKLWRDHLRSKPGALERLIAYNREDVVNLEPLMEHAYGKLVEQLRGHDLLLQSRLAL